MGLEKYSVKWDLFEQTDTGGVSSSKFLENEILNVIL